MDKERAALKALLATAGIRSAAEFTTRLGSPRSDMTYMEVFTLLQAESQPAVTDTPAINPAGREAFIEMWKRHHGEAEVSIADLAPLACEVGYLSTPKTHCGEREQHLLAKCLHDLGGEELTGCRIVGADERYTLLSTTPLPGLDPPNAVALFIVPERLPQFAAAWEDAGDALPPLASPADFLPIAVSSGFLSHPTDTPLLIGLLTEALEQALYRGIAGTCRIGKEYGTDDQYYLDIANDPSNPVFAEDRFADFVNLWRDRYGSRDVNIRALVPLMAESGYLMGPPPGPDTAPDEEWYECGEAVLEHVAEIVAGCLIVGDGCDSGDSFALRAPDMPPSPLYAFTPSDAYVPYGLDACEWLHRDEPELPEDASWEQHAARAYLTRIMYDVLDSAHPVGKDFYGGACTAALCSLAQLAGLPVKIGENGRADPPFEYAKRLFGIPENQPFRHETPPPKQPKMPSFQFPHRPRRVPAEVWDARNDNCLAGGRWPGEKVPIPINRYINPATGEVTPVREIAEVDEEYDEAWRVWYRLHHLDWAKAWVYGILNAPDGNPQPRRLVEDTSYTLGVDVTAVLEEIGAPSLPGETSAQYAVRFAGLNMEA